MALKFSIQLPTDRVEAVDHEELVRVEVEQPRQGGCAREVHR